MTTEVAGPSCAGGAVPHWIDGQVSLANTPTPAGRRWRATRVSGQQDRAHDRRRSSPLTDFGAANTSSADCGRGSCRRKTAWSIDSTRTGSLSSQSAAITVTMVEFSPETHPDGLCPGDIDSPYPLFVQNRDPSHTDSLVKLSCVDEHKHRLTGFSRQPIRASQEKPAPPCRGGTLRWVHVERLTRRWRGSEVLGR
jgi:hypothetical protein